MNFHCKNFNSLTLEELYQILALRSEVFVVEQNCVFQDMDFLDQKAKHCFIVKNGKIIACTRLFDRNQYFEGFLAIGRVVVDFNERKYGLGKKLMEYSIAECYKNFGNYPIKIGGQTYLKQFYENLGFRSLNDEYLEDGIPHVHMIKSE